MHCGNTTVAYSPEYEDLFKVEGIKTESVEEYLEQIEAWKFLSDEGKRHLFDTFMTWDPEYAANMVDAINDDGDHYRQFENNVGDEGMWNLRQE